MDFAWPVHSNATLDHANHRAIGERHVARRNPLPIVAALVVGIALIVVVRLVTSGGKNEAASSVAPTPRAGCTTVHVAASSEKAALMATIADRYNRSDRRVGGACYGIAVRSVASGTAEANLAGGWDESTDGPAPDAWTPAASTWLSLLQTDAASHDKRDVNVPADVQSVTSTPLAIAMPEPMARALGWPQAPIGWSDLLTLANDSRGWAAKSHPEWGAFALGKTNPTISTSGLSATIGAFVAATGTSSDLTDRSLADPKVRAFVAGVERAVVHYGDTTLTYLANLQRADDAGAALTYVSAVAVEEKSVLDYDAGNPTGDPATLGKHAPPKIPLVAVYPKEGTIYSDSPFAILDVPWATDAKKAGARDFLTYLREPAQQKTFTGAGFRTFDHQPGAPITASKSVLPDGVKIALKPPNGEVLVRVRSTWAELRKRARILLVLDVSGSMGDPAGSSGKTKLELAKSAALAGLGQLSPSDQVGLWTFTTNLNTPSRIYAELVPIGPLADRRPKLEQAINGLSPLNGTPLYAATRAASAYLRSTDDPRLINAVVLLTDGQNEYPADNDLPGLVKELSAAASEGGARVFSIAYGKDADLPVLKSISEASRAAAYDATNPASIGTVFVSVLSNF